MMNNEFISVYIIARLLNNHEFLVRPNLHSHYVNNLLMTSFISLYRGGIVASSDSSSRPSSNEPPTTPAMTTATRNSHHRVTYEQSDDDSGDMDIRNSTTASANGQVIQSRVHEYDKDLLTSALVQTVNLRCSAGRVYWRDPVGGLKISIHPSVKKPYRLCLENRSTLKSVRILLEQSSTTSSSGVSLLPILTSSDSKCYQMYGDSGSGGFGSGGIGVPDEPTVIYIEHSSESSSSQTESALPRDGDGDGDVELQLLDDVDADGFLINQNHLENDFPEDDGASSSINSKGNTISLYYEIESFRGKAKIPASV
jgi:hypothetical protein